MFEPPKSGSWEPFLYAYFADTIRFKFVTCRWCLVHFSLVVYTSLGDKRQADAPTSSIFSWQISIAAGNAKILPYAPEIRTPREGCPVDFGGYYPLFFIFILFRLTTRYRVVTIWMNLLLVHSSEGTMDKKQQLYDAAKSIFSEKGFKDTNIAAITKAAHMAVGTFYLYYSSKA